LGFVVLLLWIVAVEIVPVSPVIGAEIQGVDLSRPLTPEQFSCIHEAWLRHQVLFFRDQKPLSPEAQIAFGKLFGELHVHPAAPSLDGYAEVMAVRTGPDSKKHFGEVWHSDVSCEEEPPSGTILQMHVLPPSGGDTLFSSMYAVYEGLSNAMRRFLEGLTAEHESEHYYRGRYSGVADEGRVYPRAEHPVIQTHPETGQRGLFVNSMFTTRIAQLNPEESQALLRFLFEQVENPYYQTRFQWRRNDVVVWDNRCVQHLAIWDYWPHERKGHRVTVRGSRPVLL
jgi:alpha-ketoglutarate-dependent taurine dioxygenase